MVLRAAERLHALAVRGRRSRRCSLAIGVEPTNETDATPGCVEQRVDRLLVAVHDVEHAGGQPGLGEQLGEQQRRRRVLLARLEDERVPARDREREHPHRHHRGEVERRDADATRRAAGAASGESTPVADLLGRLALQQVRRAARELDDLEAALDLAARVVDGLAVLGGDDPGELVGVRGEQLAEPEQHVRALGERLRAPRLEAGGRGGTARSTSSRLANATRRVTAPVAGSVTSP